MKLLRRLAKALRDPAPLRWVRRKLRRLHPGTLLRHHPVSDRYGLDRGRPVDRVYIEDFLAANADGVRGRVLEVKNDHYTRRFGGERVTHADVVDIDDRNRDATIIADLARRDSLPPSTFDCIILTQTLQLLPDVTTALRNAWRALKPGGSLLITVPTASKVEPSYPDLWRWTPAGLAQQISLSIPEAEPTVEAYGNLIAMIAHLYGLAVEDLESADDLLRLDEQFPLIAAARVDRPATK